MHVYDLDVRVLGKGGGGFLPGCLGCLATDLHGLDGTVLEDGGQEVDGIAEVGEDDEFGRAVLF